MLQISSPPALETEDEYEYELHYHYQLDEF